MVYNEYCCNLDVGRDYLLAEDEDDCSVLPKYKINPDTQEAYVVTRVTTKVSVQYHTNQQRAGL